MDDEEDCSRCGNQDYNLLLDREMDYWQSIKSVADAAIRALYDKPSENGAARPEEVIRGRRLQEMTDFGAGLPWFERQRQEYVSHAAPMPEGADVGELVREFVAVVERASYWVGPLETARAAQRALVTPSSGSDTAASDEVAALTASTQWHEWLRLRECGGVTL